MKSNNTFYGLQNGLSLESLKQINSAHYLGELRGDKQTWFLHICFLEESIIQFRYSTSRKALISPFLELKLNPSVKTKITKNRISTNKIDIHIDSNPLAISVRDKEANIISQDVPGLGFWTDSEEIRCYKQIQSLEHTPCIYGLGDKTGEINHWGQRFRNAPLDALGYDSKSSDPLYKDIPFFIHFERQNKIAHGIFFDNLSPKFFDFGRERKPIPYYHFGAASSELSYYLILGPSIAEVVQGYNLLSGRVPLVPKFTLGYLASGMVYTEEDKSSQKIIGMLSKANALNIKTTAFHLSSGYTLDKDKRRLQFNWNRSKFPNPQGFSATCKELGAELCANVKPVLLKEHALYDEAAKLGLFIGEKSKQGYKAVLESYWSGMGSYMDFSLSETQSWWKDKLKRHILAQGIRGIWNDNNEYEINSPHQYSSKTIQMPLLMAKTAWEASQEYYTAENPNKIKRPWILSRSGYAGIQKYAQSWTGDNYSSWNSLKYDNAILLSMGLSGLIHSGCDIGGFWGESPDPELLLRWIQNGIFQPRFCLHSYKETPTEPWLHAKSKPEYFSIIRDFMNLRDRLLPYIYQAAYRASLDGTPIMRPLVYDFPDDPQTHDLSFEYMFGDSLLIAPITEPMQGSSLRHRVYLPANHSWINWFNHKEYKGGEWIEEEFNAKNFPVYIRNNSVIPMLETIKSKEVLKFYVCSNKKKTKLSYSYYDDDGEHEISSPDDFIKNTYEFSLDNNSVNMKLIHSEGNFTLGYKTVSERF